MKLVILPAPVLVGCPNACLPVSLSSCFHKSPCPTSTASYSSDLCNGYPVCLLVQDRSVRSGSDPVLWHCFGLTHIVRPEDFPVMPVESAGFTLKPVGFFRGNPAIDIPYQPNAASKLCCGTANGHANALSNGHANGHADGNSANGSSDNGYANGQANGH